MADDDLVARLFELHEGNSEATAVEDASRAAAKRVQRSVFRNEDAQHLANPLDTVSRLPVAALSAVDVLGIPSSLIGMVSPKAKEKIDSLYKSDPVASAFGSTVSPMALLTKPIKAGIEAVKQAPAITTALGSAVASILPSDTAETSGKFNARAQSKAKDFEERMKAKRELEAEEAKAGSVKKLRAESLPDADTLKEMGMTRETYLNAPQKSIDSAVEGLAKRRIEAQEAIKKAEEDKLASEAPFRERYPGVSTAAPFLATGLALMIGLGLKGRTGWKDSQYAKEWRNKLDEAEKVIALESPNSKKVKQLVEEFKTLLKEAPERAKGSDLALITSSGLLGAEGAAFPETADFFGQPKGSRAYQEAVDAAKDPSSLPRLAMSAASAASASKLGNVIGSKAFKVDYPTASSEGMVKGLTPVSKTTKGGSTPSQGGGNSNIGLPANVPLTATDEAGKFMFLGPDKIYRYGNGKIAPKQDTPDFKITPVEGNPFQ